MDMEATGRDGGAWGPSWSYRKRHEEIGSSSYTISSSSRSGTIVSSAAYISGASRSSRLSSMEAALELDLELELRLGTPDILDAEFAQPIKKPRIETEETLKEKRMKHIKSLVQDFFGTSSANSNNEGGDMNVLERWFTELGVSWVLQLDVAASASVLENPLYKAIIWSRALIQIMETIHLTEYFFPDHGHGFVSTPGISEEEVESRNQSLDPLQFARFFQKALSKMLVFVDTVFNRSFSIVCEDGDPHVCYLYVHSTLSEVLLGIRFQFHSSPPADLVEEIEKEMVSLLEAKQGKAFEAIWSTIEENRNRVLKSMEEYSSGTQTPQGSSDIHKATCSVMDHISFLLCNYSAVSELVSKATSLGKYVPGQTGLGQTAPLVSLITEMVSCLEEKLITKSQLFLDQGLRFLFLLNNSNFILDYLIRSNFIKVEIDVTDITRKVEEYIESYIQVSWGPMLACLFNPTPLCLWRNHSPLSKFEYEFQKIYTTQKLWKVPHPELRKRLRKAVIQKIIPGYTKYIEDSKVTNPNFSPQKLEEMLQELFEG